MTAVFTAPCGESHTEQHEAAYALLRRAALCLYSLPPDTAVAVTEKGKPYFPDHPEIRFSIAHTAGAAAVALGDVPCGIDIEGEREIPEGVRRRFLDGVSAKEALTAWTKREAYGKLQGDGFFAPPPEEGEVSFTGKWECIGGKRYFVMLCETVSRVGSNYL